MRVHLDYGTGGLDIDVPAPNVTVLAPVSVPGLQDEKSAFLDAVRCPLGGRPLRLAARSGERLAVVIPDLTRPFPSARVLPWLLEELAQVPERDVVLINGTGSHRPNTEAELASMVGEDVLRRVRVVNHNAHDPSTLAAAGQSPGGETVFMNREYVEADRRIVLHARVALFSEIPAEEVRRAHLEPVCDIGARIEEELGRIGAGAPVAVLPEGPMTIPYIA